MHNKSKEQWNKEQSELYKDPRWQKKRLEIFQRDKFTCQFCQSKIKTLTVHHLEYHGNAKPWDYKDKELITVCEDCHIQETKYRKIYETTLIKILKKYKFSVDDIKRICQLFLSMQKNKRFDIELFKFISYNEEYRKTARRSAVHYIIRKKIKDLLEK